MPAPATNETDPPRPSLAGRIRRYFVRRLVALPLFLLGCWFLPYFWCAREADSWFDGDPLVQRRLADGVAAWTERGVSENNFSTGSEQFDGEWLFGTYMMAAMGFGQTALEHPELRAEHLSRMDLCLERMLDESSQRFDKDSWGDGPLESLESDERHHAAYLGYANLALSLRRSVDRNSPTAELNDRITEALVRRIERTPGMLLLTYPSETYPVDNAAVLASIALHDRVTGANHGDLVERWIGRCRSHWIDPKSGLLYQSWNERTDRHLDEPRGSGTALAAYYLTYADAALSRDLFQAIRRELAGRILSFGVVREYPAGSKGGYGDIDSGPLVFGHSISATGFSLATARTSGDRDFYRRVYATSYLFGAPTDRGRERSYVTGGPLGDAILFAVLTSSQAEQVTKGSP